MNNAYDIIGRPVLTEKTADDLAVGKITFRVNRDATKTQIKEAFQTIFNVKIDRVNTARMPGKPKRWGRRLGHRPGYKKAIITLAEGEELDLFMLDEAVETDEEQD